MTVESLIAKGVLVSPRTKARLIPTDDGRHLVSLDGKEEYDLLDGTIPVLLRNPVEMKEYSQSSDIMNREYSEYPERKRRLHMLVKRVLTQDYRSPRAIRAVNDIVENVSKDDVAVSVGGGPKRRSKWFLNLNIGAFPNVDIVADAHNMLFADDTVDCIDCETVLEHLYEPRQAVNEMYRICRPGGISYVCAPFLQAYHGYPFHYKNFSLTGLINLVEGSGFRVVESGTYCTGPSYAVAHLTLKYIRNFIPKIVRLPMALLYAVLMLLFKPYDRILNQREDSHILSCSTFMVAQR